MAKKVTLTAEGETDEEVKATLLFMLGVNGTHGTTTAAVVEPVSTDGGPAWTQDELGQFWKALTPGARKILTEMAKKPGGYPFDDIRKALSLEALQIAGRLSSMGHQMRAFKGKSDLIWRDWHAQQYRMKPEFAEMIRRQ